jgi:hypothetical protein
MRSLQDTLLKILVVIGIIIYEETFGTCLSSFS